MPIKRQQLPNKTKKGHLDELLRSLHSQISSLKSEIGFLREEVKEKNNVIGILLGRNSCECNSSSPCERPKLDNISGVNEEHCDTCIFTTSNSIQSDNNHQFNNQFTKLAKQKSRVKDVPVDSVNQAHPDETKHLTNTGVTSSNINEMSHIINKEDPLIKKEINHNHHLKTQLTPKNLKH